MNRLGASRTGASAPEALVALMLGLFLVHLGLSTMARLRTAETRLSQRTDGVVAMRVARHVLRRELRHGRPGEDWSAEGDTIWLRAFRGTALVCPVDTATAELTVAFRGDRRPDASKDSVLLFDAAGSRTVRALVSVATAPAPCGSAALPDLEVWRLDAPLPAGTIAARLFERGSYHLNSAALRYRRGASGRQPLTPEVWSSETGWVNSGGHLTLEAFHSDPAAGRPWSVFLSWLE